MSKRSISQLLDGAAFPAIMLAIAVSQIKIGPHQGKALPQGKGVAVEAQADDWVKQGAQAAQAH